MIKDYFLYKRMLVPFLVQFIFWLGVIAVIVTGIIDISHGLWFFGIVTIILGPILVRLVCEYIVVLFEINETLTDIKELLGGGRVQISPRVGNPINPINPNQTPLL